MTNKKCVLNYHNIDDPWDVDDNGIFKYAQTQVTNEQVIVVDDYCIVAYVTHPALSSSMHIVVNIFYVQFLTADFSPIFPFIEY